MRFGSWILTASVEGKFERARLAVDGFDLDQQIVPVAIAAFESFAGPSLGPPDVDCLPRLVARRSLFEKYAGPGVRVRWFFAMQWHARFQHAHGVVFQNHFVVVRREGDRVSGIGFDYSAAAGGL